VIAAGDVAANGRDVQRDMVGRVVSVDAARGRLVVERTVQGKRFHVALRASPAAPVFACGEAGRVADLRGGDRVGVWYEAAGREGIANLVAVEAAR
jgi:hypothetical protein